MSKYMVLYRSSLGPGEQMGTPEQAQKGLQAWMNWAGQAGSALVDMGSPVNSSVPMAPPGRPASASAATRSWKPTRSSQ